MACPSTASANRPIDRGTSFDARPDPSYASAWTIAIELAVELPDRVREDGDADDEEHHHRAESLAAPATCVAMTRVIPISPATSAVLWSVAPA